jgi:hypothetical protein
MFAASIASTRSPCSRPSGTASGPRRAVSVDPSEKATVTSEYVTPCKSKGRTSTTIASRSPSTSPPYCTARGTLRIVTTIVVGTAAGVDVIGDRTDHQMKGQECTALALEGHHIWAVLDGTAFWRGSPGGAWKGVAELQDHRARCALPHDGQLFVGTAAAHLMRLLDGQVEPVATFEEIEGREKWYTPWGGPPDTRSMSASYGTIYVNVHVGGIVRSTDGGQSWEPTIDIDADVHQVLAHPEVPGLVLAATAGGLARSDDGGGSWSFHDEGLHAPYSRAVAVAGETLLLSASTGPRGGRAAVYHRPLDTDGSFERCQDGLPEWFGGNVDTHCLAASGATVAFGTEDGDLFLSEDESRTWERAASDLASIRAVVLV